MLIHLFFQLKPQYINEKIHCFLEVVYSDAGMPYISNHL